MLRMTSKILVLLVLLLSASPVRSDAAPPSRLKADFHMTRTIRQLKDAVHSEGKLLLGGPGRLRWETMSPARSVLVINRDKGWLHYPDLKVTKEFDVSSDPVMKVLSEHLLALTGGDLKAISAMYDIHSIDEKTKELTPKQGEIKKLFARMRVSTDAAGRISSVELVSRNGDTTTIAFSDVEVNPAIPDSAFDKPEVR